MTGSSAPLRAFALAGFVFCGGTLALAQPALRSDDAFLSFDIPAQPLSDSLREFARVTRLPTLYRSELVVGLESSAVHGRFAAPVALARMLENTGLVAQRIESDTGPAFVLRTADGGASGTGGRGGLGNLAGYPAFVQASVMAALCAREDTAPGGYRALLRFRVGPGGALESVELMSGTGDAHRDRAIVTGLRQLTLDFAPPADLRQPLTLLIAPNARQGQGAGIDSPAPCAAGRRDR
ncbi:STN domain-containing protein [Pandoraea pulmonicola]|uniref:Outer membrane receptor for ferric coprogen and ferric-rhodotorulic acid n=1 Tax=Pandoraea pulmonicola TaxID=93221 RepID=A0AAJ4ZGN9_PANPU|nr:STN domain-containing protein [Pandoraea pulmonicola]SUA92979.1 Outer membrane receptor for ferric coprogen and ferric-rhodotorulic acid [Pandoraea pulmonicola]